MTLLFTDNCTNLCPCINWRLSVIILFLVPVVCRLYRDISNLV